MNTVILKGNLTRDPQLSFLPSQTPVCEFGMAVNEKRKDTEKTHFFDLSIFGKRAEVLQKYVHKGDPLLIRGKLDFQQWEKDGQKHSKIKIIVEDFDFIASKKSDRQEPQSQGEAPYGENQDIPF
jgi:single-strand DNA-binding protein